MRRVSFLLLGLFALGIPGRAQTHVVQKFDGNSSTTTAPFTVNDKWEVVWNTPMPLRITLLSSDGTIVAGTAGMFRGSFYLPKGGTYYLQVNGADNGPTAPWHLSVVELGGDSQSSPSVGLNGPEMNFVPPSVQPPGNTAANPAATNVLVNPAPVAAVQTPAPAAPAVNLTEDQTRAVVMIEGDNAEGTGFLVKGPDGPAVVTNIHVIAGNPNVRILTNTGAQIVVTGLKGAADRDLAMFSIQDAHYSYLDLNTDISNSVQPGDDVITPGNSQGGEVVLNTHGTVVGIGPERVEFSNPIYHGNSGGPVFQTKTGKVLAVVTEATKVDTNNDLDKASFANHGSAITTSMRYFGLRLDTVPKWETYDLSRFLTETTFLDQFHQQSRQLDSYLNYSEKTDNQASNPNDENAAPSSKLFLTNSKIVKADEEFTRLASGADGSQRLDAYRGWLFELTDIADMNMQAIQDPSNFYGFDQQRARDEVAYRKALKKELDSFGDDISRAESLGHRNN